MLEDRKLLSASGIGAFAPTTATWSLRSTPTAGPADIGTFQFGAYVPVTGDWNGDGVDDIGTFNPATATWSLRYETSAGPADAGVFVFGKKRTLPVVGDWNGDGRDDIGVYDPKTAQWSLRLGASAGPANAGTFTFGSKNALPVAGDWDGDKKDGIGTFSPPSSTWTLRQTPNGGSANVGKFWYGPKNTLPAVGDWNGDGKDGIGTVDPKTATWRLRQTPNTGTPNAGTFVFGPKYALPVSGIFNAPAPAANVISNITIKPLDLNLLGLEVQTSPITITVSTTAGDAKLIGNMLSSGQNLINTTQVNGALNNVLNTATDLVNTSPLSLLGVSSGAFDTAAPSTTQVMELFVAPTHLATLGAQIDTSPIRLSISAHAGNGLVLGNALTVLSNLFNPPLPSSLDIDFINQKLADTLDQLNLQLGSIPAADVPAIQPNPGDILTFAMPGIDMNLLGLNLKTDPVLVDAATQANDGSLLGNVWAVPLQSSPATPDKMAQMVNTADGVLARVFGALDASSLTLASSAITGLSPATQALLSPTLFGPAGSSAQIVQLTSSASANSPATVSLLGLSIASNNLNASLSATTGDGLVLGNLLYNASNLTNPGASASMVSLLSQLASGSTAAVAPISGVPAPATSSSSQLFTVTLPPLDLNSLGLEVQTDAVTVKLTAESGGSDLLGNVLRGYTSLLNLSGISAAVNNVLSAATGLANSASLSVAGVGSGAFDTASPSTTQVLDATVAPIHFDVAGMLAETNPIHLKLIAHAGNGLVLGNVLTTLANLFNAPLPDHVDTAAINGKLQQLLTNLDAQAPGIPPATLPSAAPDPATVAEVTVPALNLDLLGMTLKTDPIFVGVAAHTGNGDLLGNVYTTLLNTLTSSSADLGGVSNNVNALLAKVIGVFNASTLTLSASALSSLAPAYQTLASPTLINPTAGATASIIDLGNAATGTNLPSSATMLGLAGLTSNIHLTLTARTGDGLVLGNMLYNLANLLNGGTSPGVLYLL
ncbi:MAG TPA: VCBS repeat-containing protein, partial [Tepidisphaeraceae bacterium]|nr:VCBS repeat-containing protein [Tepidisphaeraceae bacterium]